MLTKKFLNEEEIQNLANAASSYQKNCLLLEEIRLMDMERLELFCKLLKSIDGQKHIADVLVNGKLKPHIAFAYRYCTYQKIEICRTN